MSIDLVNQVFREGERYAGDGLPDEPVAAALPIGDRRSGPHHPSKAEIREALIAVLGTLPRAEAAAAAAEAAAALALSYTSDAVSQGNVPIYASTEGVEGLEIPEGLSAIRTNGYADPGDGGGALFVRVGAEPGHAGKVQSDDGAWWEIAEPVVTPRMIGWSTGDGWATMRALMGIGRDVAVREAMTATAVDGETLALCAGATHDLRGLTIHMPAAYAATGVRVTVGAGARVNVLRITGASGVGNVRRFVSFGAGSVTDLVHVDCATPTGPGAGTLDGFLQFRENDVTVGRIRARNVDWLGKAYQVARLRIGSIEIEGIMHGLSVDECTDFWIGRATCKTKSALAGPDPGNNLLTIGSSDDGQVDLVVAEDTAEHGIYVAGRCRRVKFGHVTTRRTGQCGFKCRSGFGADNSEDVSIDHLRVEDAAYGSIAGSNEDGLRVEYATRFSVGHLEVHEARKGDTQPSAYDGVYLNAVDGFVLGGGYIERTANAAIRIVDVGGANYNIVIHGVTGYSLIGDAIVIDHTTGNDLRHLMITDCFFNLVGGNLVSAIGGPNIAPQKCYVDIKYAQLTGSANYGGAIHDPDLIVRLTHLI